MLHRVEETTEVTALLDLGENFMKRGLVIRNVFLKPPSPNKDSGPM
jgi:hypothetical protein